MWVLKKIGYEQIGYEKSGYEQFWVRKNIWGYGEVVPVDLSIKLKEDGNQAVFTFINGPGVGNVDMDGQDRPCCHKRCSVLIWSQLVNK
jgi:hypothetical protein